jgi:hypothetical protein
MKKMMKCTVFQVNSIKLEYFNTRFFVKGDKDTRQLQVPIYPGLDPQFATMLKTTQ